MEPTVALESLQPDPPSERTESSTNPLADDRQQASDMVPGAATSNREQYPSLYRLLTGMGARGPLPWRVFVTVSLLLVLAFMTTFGPTSLTGRTQRIPEDLPIQIWGAATPLYAVSAQLLFAYKLSFAGPSMLMDQMLMQNTEDAGSRIELIAGHAVKLWYVLSSLMVPAGILRIADTLRTGNPQLAPFLGFIYFVVMPSVWALSIGVPVAIYASTMSIVAKFTVVQSKLLQSHDGLSSAQLINALNADCNEFSRAATPIVVTLAILALSGIFAMMAAIAGITTHESAKIVMFLWSFVSVTLSLGNLWIFTKVQSASEQLLESISLARDSADLDLVKQAGDTDGDGELSYTEAMRIELRQLFVAQSLQRINGGLGSECTTKLRSCLSTANFWSGAGPLHAMVLMASKVGFKVGSIVITPSFVQSLGTAMYTLLGYLFQSSDSALDNMVAEVASLRHIVDYHSAMFDLVSLQLGELANATGANVIKRSLCNATTTQVACWD